MDDSVGLLGVKGTSGYKKKYNKDLSKKLYINCDYIPYFHDYTSIQINNPKI